MYNRLDEVKRQHEGQKKKDIFGVTLYPRDIDWLIEQAEKVKKYETALKEIAKDEEYCKEQGEMGYTDHYNGWEKTDIAIEVLKG